MRLDPQYLENVISGDTGLDFVADSGVDADGRYWYLLRPRDLPSDHTFAIRTTVDWRRLGIAFEPGKFAAELLADMGRTDDIGRAAFRAVLADCSSRGAQINLRVNGSSHSFDEETVWVPRWNRFAFSMTKGQLELGADEGEPDGDIICRWTRRFAASIVAILPLEEQSDANEPDVTGYPEGALTKVNTNRYERDRRNRAAAISIHGTSCQSCNVEMGQRYGRVAAGFIEVHHTTSVSLLKAGYVVDPARDLVPLCPNCHRVAHRRMPPYSVNEIRQMLRGE